MTYIPKPPLVPFGGLEPWRPYLDPITSTDPTPSLTAFYGDEVTPEMIEEAYPADWTTPAQVAELVEAGEILGGEGRADLLEQLAIQAQPGFDAWDWYAGDFPNYLYGEIPRDQIMWDMVGESLVDFDLALGIIGSFALGVTAGFGGALAAALVYEATGSTILGLGTGIAIGYGVWEYIGEPLGYQWGGTEWYLTNTGMAYDLGLMIGAGIYLGMEAERQMREFGEGFAAGIDAGENVVFSPPVPSADVQDQGAAYQYGWEAGAVLGYMGDWAYEGHKAVNPAFYFLEYNYDDSLLYMIDLSGSLSYGW